MLGGTPDDAFFVACDRRTMTAVDVDVAAGRLFVVLDVSQSRPAEFIVMRFAVLTGSDR